MIINLKESWTDAYKHFSDIVDNADLSDLDGIQTKVDELYAQHKGEPDWDEAYRRWCETLTDDDLDESINSDGTSFTTRCEFSQSESSCEDYLKYLKQRDEAKYGVKFSAKQIDDDFCDITISGTPEAVKAYKDAYQLEESINADKAQEGQVYTLSSNITLGYIYDLNGNAIDGCKDAKYRWVDNVIDSITSATNGNISVSKNKSTIKLAPGTNLRVVKKTNYRNKPSLFMQIGDSDYAIILDPWNDFGKMSLDGAPPKPQKEESDEMWAVYMVPDVYGRIDTDWKWTSKDYDETEKSFRARVRHQAKSLAEKSFYEYDPGSIKIKYFKSKDAFLGFCDKIGLKPRLEESKSIKESDDTNLDNIQIVDKACRAANIEYDDIIDDPSRGLVVLYREDKSFDETELKSIRDNIVKLSSKLTGCSFYEDTRKIELVFDTNRINESEGRKATRTSIVYLVDYEDGLSLPFNDRDTAIDYAIDSDAKQVVKATMYHFSDDESDTDIDGDNSEVIWDAYPNPTTENLEESYDHMDIEYIAGELAAWSADTSEYDGELDREDLVSMNTEAYTKDLQNIDFVNKVIDLIQTRIKNIGEPKYQGEIDDLEDDKRVLKLLQDYKTYAFKLNSDADDTSMLEKMTNENLEESLDLDSTVTIGLYGDELDLLGLSSVDELAKYFTDKGIEVVYKSGDVDYGWDLGVKGNPRDIFNAVNGKIIGYNCATTSEFVDKYAVDDDYYKWLDEPATESYDKVTPLENVTNEALKIGDLVTHVDDSPATRGTIVGIKGNTAKVCVGDSANKDYVDVDLDKLQLDESAYSMFDFKVDDDYAFRTNNDIK